MSVAPILILGIAATRFDGDGNLTDDTTRRFIRDLLSNLVDWTRWVAPPPGEKG